MRNTTIWGGILLVSCINAFVPSLPSSSFRQNPCKTILKSTQTDRDFYEILGIGRDASPQDIKSAYRRLAKAFHPDVNPHQDTVAQFHDVCNAYDVLGNPFLRHKYDVETFGIPRGGWRQVGPPPYGSYVNTNGVKNWAGAPYDNMDAYNHDDPYQQQAYDTTAYNDNDAFHGTHDSASSGFRQVGPPPYGTFLNNKGVKDWSAPSISDPDFRQQDPYGKSDPYRYTNNGYNDSERTFEHHYHSPNDYNDAFVADTFNDPASYETQVPFTDYTENGVRQVGPPPYGSFLNSEDKQESWGFTTYEEPNGEYVYSPSGYNDPNVKFRNGKAVPFGTGFTGVEGVVDDNVEDVYIDANTYYDASAYDASTTYDASDYETTTSDATPGLHDVNTKQPRNGGPSPFRSGFGHSVDIGDVSDGFTSSNTESGVQWDDTASAAGNVDANGYTSSNVDASGYTTSNVDVSGYTANNVDVNGYTADNVDVNGYTTEPILHDEPVSNRRRIHDSRTLFNGFAPQVNDFYGDDSPYVANNHGYQANTNLETGIGNNAYHASESTEQAYGGGDSNSYHVPPTEQADDAVNNGYFAPEAATQQARDSVNNGYYAPESSAFELEVDGFYPESAEFDHEAANNGYFAQESTEVEHDAVENGYYAPESTVTEQPFGSASAYFHPNRRPYNGGPVNEPSRSSYYGTNDVVQEYYDTEEPFGSGSGYNDPNLKRKYVRSMYEPVSLHPPFDYGNASDSTMNETNGFPFSNTTQAYETWVRSSYGEGLGQQIDYGRAFGGFRSANGRPVPIVGEDLQVDLEIDLKTAVFGGNETILISHLETCDDCNGKGVETTKCTTCDGLGVKFEKKREMHGNAHTEQACPDCHGTGELIGGDCYTCGKQGLIQRNKNVTVCVPAGVESFTRLRVRGEGDAGPHGGPAGDLYVFLTVKEHPTSTRRGLELHSEQDIDILDALLGTSVQCPLVDGEVTIDVPAGVQHGTEIRLEGLGAHKLGEPSVRGDHCVTMNIEIPTDLSKEEEAIVKRIKELQNEAKAKMETLQNATISKTDAQNTTTSKTDAQNVTSKTGVQNVTKSEAGLQNATKLEVQDHSNSTSELQNVTKVETKPENVTKSAKNELHNTMKSKAELHGHSKSKKPPRKKKQQKKKKRGWFFAS